MSERKRYNIKRPENKYLFSPTIEFREINEEKVYCNRTNSNDMITQNDIVRLILKGIQKKFRVNCSNGRSNEIHWQTDANLSISLYATFRLFSSLTDSSIRDMTTDLLRNILTQITKDYEIIFDDLKIKICLCRMI
jgi:hypothetical protein